MKKAIIGGLLISTLVLATLVIYQFSIISKDNNTINSFQMKQKCHDEALKYMDKFQAHSGNNPDSIYSLTADSYNKKLNTCVVDYQFYSNLIPGGVENTEDVLTNSRLAQWNFGTHTGWSKDDSSCCKTRNDFIDKLNLLMGQIVWTHS